jgi:hypothetical protein
METDMVEIFLNKILLPARLRGRDFSPETYTSSEHRHLHFQWSDEVVEQYGLNVDDVATAIFL